MRYFSLAYFQELTARLCSEPQQSIYKHTHYFLNSHRNVIFASTSRGSNWFLPFMFPN